MTFHRLLFQEGKSSNKKNKIHPFKIGDEEVIITAQNKNSDEEERDSWTGTLDFFFSALSYSGKIHLDFRLVSKNIASK